MFVNVVPPSVETCHCTVPLLAAAAKFAVVPLHAVWFVGLLVIDGAAVTVRVAAVVVDEPELFVKTARYCLPLSADVVEKLYEVDVALTMLLNVTPLSLETCHCTVGAGKPLAAAVNVAVAPTQTV